jgi:cytoskeletal protein CcmA (bactofilin family)
MADQADDLGVPTRPTRTPPRLNGSIGPTDAASIPKASNMARVDQAERRTMIVGSGISLSGEIKSCNRLVVEGRAEVMLLDCREIEIAENGVFKGNASIEQAEVRGQLEGKLTVRKRLLIRSTGRVSGTIIYSEIEIEAGGKVSGTLQAQ